MSPARLHCDSIAIRDLKQHLKPITCFGGVFPYMSSISSYFCCDLKNPLEAAEYYSYPVMESVSK